MSTNGLLLPEKIDLLEELGLHSLTVTINAIDPAVGARIYSHINFHGMKLTGTEAASILIANQLTGLEKAAAYGMTVKVNTVLIPGVNDDQIQLVASKVKSLGADVMNVMPIIPQADFAGITPPSPADIAAIQNANEKIIGQFKHCKQCRADAVGLIGKDMQFATRACNAA
jgi:nitrogen fixation protein NifB